MAETDEPYRHERRTTERVAWRPRLASSRATAVLAGDALAAAVFAHVFAHEGVGAAPRAHRAEQRRVGQQQADVVDVFAGRVGKAEVLVRLPRGAAQHYSSGIPQARGEDAPTSGRGQVAHQGGRGGGRHTATIDGATRAWVELAHG